MQCGFRLLSLRGILFDCQSHVPAITRKSVRPMTLHLVILRHGGPLGLHLISVYRGFRAHLKWADLILLHLSASAQMQPGRHHAEIKEGNNTIVRFLKRRFNRNAGMVLLDPLLQAIGCVSGALIPFVQNPSP